MHKQYGADIVYTFGNKKVVAAFCGVVVITFLCFIPDLSNDFVWDDGGYILTNTNITELSFETVRWAFFEFHTSYWAPLTWLSLALDYSLWELNPVGYHLTNNFLHAINAGMFFLLAWELLKIYLSLNTYEGNRSNILNENRAIYCALMAALIFALHPLRVESVAWAAERKDVLALFFGIPAIVMYLRHTQSVAVQTAFPDRRYLFPFSRYYWLSVVFHILSMLSKPWLVTLPAVLLVLDWFPLRRLRRAGLKEVFLEKIPFLVMACFVSVVTLIANRQIFESFEQLNITTRLLNALNSIMAYLWLTVWPLDLSPFYLRPANITNIGIDYSPPILFFIIVTTACLLAVKRKPVFMTVWMIYLITLLPVLGFAQAGPQGMAARYTYLPGLSVAMLAALGLTAALVWSSPSKMHRIAMHLGIAVLLLFYSYNTVQQISFWKDDVTLWTRVIDLKPHTIGRAYFQRASAYETKGEFQKALTDINEALAIAASKKYGKMHEIYYYRASIRKQLGDFDGAIADLSSALLTVPPAERHLFYFERGSIYVDQGKVDLANEDFRLAVMVPNE